MDKGKKSEKDLIRKYGDLDPYEVLYDELLSILQDDFQIWMSRESTKQDLVNRFLDEISAMKKKTQRRPASSLPSLLSQTPPSKKVDGEEEWTSPTKKDRTKRSENLGKKNSGKQLPHSRTETSSQLSAMKNPATYVSPALNRLKAQSQRRGKAEHHSSSLSSLSSPSSSSSSSYSPNPSKSSSQFSVPFPGSPEGKSPEKKQGREKEKREEQRQREEEREREQEREEREREQERERRQEIQQGGGGQEQFGEEDSVQFVGPSLVEIILCILILTLEICLVHFIFTVYTTNTVLYCDPHSDYSGPCIPCPLYQPGAYYCKDGKLHCISGYIPVRGQCIPDKDRQKQIALMKENTQQILCQRRANYLCERDYFVGPLIMENTDVPWIGEYKLRSLLAGGGYSQFDEVYGEVLYHLTQRKDEHISLFDISPEGERRWICGEEGANSFLPPLCALERFASLNVEYIAAAFVLFIVSVWVVHSRNEKKKMDRLARLFFEEITLILQDQTQRAQQWLAEEVIREDVFSKFPRVAQWKKQEIWKRVSSQIHLDQRFLKLPRNDHGEQKDTWQWNGVL